MQESTTDAEQTTIPFTDDDIDLLSKYVELLLSIDSQNKEEVTDDKQNNGDTGS